MLSHLSQTRTRIFQLADGCLFAIALLAAYFLRDAFSRWFHWPALETMDGYIWLLPAVAVLGPVVLAGQGFYEPPRPTQRLRSLFIVLRSCTFTVVGLILFLFILREQLARSGGTPPSGWRPPSTPSLVPEKLAAQLAHTSPNSVLR